LDVVYGISCQSMDDPYIKRAIDSLRVLHETRNPGRFWIEFMPILKHVPSWVPGASAVKFGKQWRPVVDDMLNIPFEAVKNGAVSISRVCPELLQ
jgi:hypothetical protein